MLLFLRAYAKTLLVSGSGALLSILVTAGLTELVFGREGYFTSYVIGVTVGILVSFYLFSKKVFVNEDRSATWRFTLFVAYMLVLVLVQTFAVKALVELMGIHWYLPVIVGTMLAVSSVSHLIYTYVIFR